MPQHILSRITEKLRESLLKSNQKLSFLGPCARPRFIVNLPEDMWDDLEQHFLYDCFAYFNEQRVGTDYKLTENTRIYIAGFGPIVTNKSFSFSVEYHPALNKDEQLEEKAVLN